MTPPPPPQSQGPKIPNPRRLLILTPTSHSQTTIPSLLHSLTGNPVLDPPPQATETTTTANPTPTTSFAGYTTHPPLPLANKYYSAEIPIWVDEIPLSPPAPGTNSKDSTEILTPSTWKSEFSGEEAKVVRDAVGAVVICIRCLEPRGEGEDVERREDWRALKGFLEAVGFVKG
ncbi:hypothetical protein BBP40_012573, partial [Aspergillus hancockii]